VAAKHIAIAGGLTTPNPTSVVVDVYSELGALLATIPNADVDRVGSTDVYLCDLRAASVAGSLALPADGKHEEKTYLLIWRDDQSNAISAVERVSGTAGRLAIDRMFRRETPVYPSTTVPSRGITAAVMAAGKPSYMKVELSPDIDDFSDPAFTYYEVFHYDDAARVEMREPSSTIPNP
jgi:hypothetical protein